MGLGQECIFIYTLLGLGVYVASMIIHMVSLHMGMPLLICSYLAGEECGVMRQSLIQVSEGS